MSGFRSDFFPESDWIISRNPIGFLPRSDRVIRSYLSFRPDQVGWSDHPIILPDRVPESPTDEYTVSQDSTQQQRARHSVWRDNHVVTSTMTSQDTESTGPVALYPLGRRKTTRTRAKNKKRKRARPNSLFQSTVRASSVLSPMLIGMLLQKRMPLKYMTMCIMMNILMTLIVYLHI